MRATWINTLRDDLAAFQAIGVRPGSDPKQNLDFFRLGTKIELLMNPADVDFIALHDSMYAFYYAKSDIEKESCNPAFIEVCQRILKREWEVLKKELKAFNDLTSGAQPSSNPPDARPWYARPAP